MFPDTASTNLPDDRAAHSVFASHCRFAAAPGRRPNLMNGSFIQLGIEVALAARRIAVTISVIAILLWCAPAQVGSSTIENIRVGIMSGIHSFRPWTSESLKHKDVYRHGAPLAVTTQRDLQIAVMDGRFQAVPRSITSAARALLVTAPNRPVAADAVSHVANNVAVFNGWITHVCKFTVIQHNCQYQLATGFCQGV